MWEVSNKQIMVLVLCFMLLLQSVQGEDHLTHIDWMKKANKTEFLRFWKTYIDYLLLVLIRTSTFTKTLFCALHGIKVNSGKFCIKYFTLRHELITRNFSVAHGKIKFNNSRTEIKPTISIEFLTPSSDSHIVGIYYVIFHLYRELKLNVTFMHISIIGKNSNVAFYKYLCKESQTSFDYSGIESSFSLYPPYYQLVFRIKTSIGVKLPVVVTTMFSVISQNILANSKLPAIKSPTITAIHRIKVAKATVFTYRMQIERYKGIVLDLYPKDRVLYLLYLGPGYLSRKINLDGNERKFINTFQCTLQVILPKMDGVQNTSAYALFRGQKLPRKLISVGNNIETVVKFPHTVCINKTTTCVLDIRNPAGYINITIISSVFKGPPHPDCIYGGITWYESLKLMSHCYKFSVSEPLNIQNRNFFSQNSSVLMVFYQYKDYSLLSVSFTVISSKCKGIRLNICGLKSMKINFVRLSLKDGMKMYLSVQSKSCFVLQFNIFPHIKYAMFGHNCEAQIMMHKEKPKQELWKFVVSGYLRAMNEKDSSASFEGFDHNFTVSKTQINHSQNYSIKEDNPLFALLFKPDILISATYYIKAPTHLNSVRLFLSVYRWSHSWVNIVVNWAGRFTKSVAITSLPGKHSLDKSLQKIVKRPEPVLVLHMFPNETVKASILVSVARTVCIFGRMSTSSPSPRQEV